MSLVQLGALFLGLLLQLAAIFFWLQAFIDFK